MDDNMNYYHCKYCGKIFNRLNKLQRHLPTHTDQRNFLCEICFKTFRQLATLKQHLTIHSSEKPYNCEVCTKSYSRMSTLISHRKTHQNTKLYKCGFCSQAFHQKGNLHHHLFTHTNERPYKCNYCEQRFNQRSNLNCHLKKVHQYESKQSNSKFFKSTSEQGNNIEEISADDGITLDGIDILKLHSLCNGNQTIFAMLICNNEMPAIVKLVRNDNPIVSYKMYPVKSAELWKHINIRKDKNDSKTVNSKYWIEIYIAVVIRIMINLYTNIHTTEIFNAYEYQYIGNFSPYQIKHDQVENEVCYKKRLGDSDSDD